MTPDLPLEKLYEEIVKCDESSLQDASSPVSASYVQAGTEELYAQFLAERKPGHVAKAKSVHWKLKGGEKKAKSKANQPFHCWNCGDEDHSARQCTQPMSEKCASQLKELRERKNNGSGARRNFNEDLDYEDDDYEVSQPYQKRQRDDDIYGPGQQGQARQTPSWMVSSNLSQGSSSGRSNRTQSGRGSQGGRGSGRVSAVFEESVVANHVQAAASSLLLLDSGANRIIIKNRKLMTTIDRSKTSNLRTADSKNSLHVDGIGTIGILEDVKFCERATTDLIAVSKLGQIGFKTSFDDAEGPVVIRRRSTGNVVCIGVQMNDLYDH